MSNVPRDLELVCVSKRLCVLGNPKNTVFFHMTTPSHSNNELVITWLQASRGLMWTEFVPTHKVQEELDRADRLEDTARADAIRKALSDRDAVHTPPPSSVAREGGRQL